MPHTAIRLPQPCAQSWAAMPLSGPGRHCAACECTVVDFSQMSQADVLAYLARTGSERVCGAFRPDQVQVLASLPAPASNWRRWAMAALTLLGLRSIIPTAAQAQGFPLGKVMVANDTPYPARVLQGQVVASDTGQPLAGVRVQVALMGDNPKEAVYTDAQGCFQLPLPPLLAGARLTIAPTNSNYRMILTRIPAPGDTAPLVVRLPRTDQLPIVGRPAPPHQTR